MAEDDYNQMVDAAFGAAAGKVRRRHGATGFLAPSTYTEGRQGFFPARLPAVDVPYDDSGPVGPLDVAMLALRSRFAAPALAAGMLLESVNPATAGKADIAKRLLTRAKPPDVPLVGNIAPRDKAFFDAPLANAPFAKFAEEYPATGPPVPKPKDKPKFEGETYLAKELTPEAREFMRARTKIQAQMNKEGYTPYFDPAQRSYVDPSKYPGPNVDTLLANVPAKPETVLKYLEHTGSPETYKRLQEAFARGEKLGDTAHWYAMAQLEKEYIKEFGAKKGRAAFLDEFAVPMAATTSGNDPGANLLMAHFLERQRKLGRPTEVETYNLPATVGGRRPAMNVRDYNAMRARGGYMGLGADQPKMHNFGRSFIGDLSRAVMDEQMSGGMLAGAPQELIDQARKGAFGMIEAPVHRLAKEKGLAPGNVQDVAWAGFKGEAGKPFVSWINEAIERTHRLTGMPRSEIVQRALVRKEIPLYGLGGVISVEALKNLDQGAATAE